jgi:hypothetical protein
VGPSSRGRESGKGVSLFIRRHLRRFDYLRCPAGRWCGEKEIMFSSLYRLVSSALELHVEDAVAGVCPKMGKLCSAEGGQPSEYVSGTVTVSM